MDLSSSSTSCIGGRWSATVDLTGSGLPARTAIFIDAQVDRASISDPFVNAYFNVYTAGAC